MGNRLSKIFTRTGDKGTTGLGDNSRIRKDAERMQTIGDIDELNSFIGLLITEVHDDTLIQNKLSKIQHILFDIGGELAMPGYTLFKDELTDELELWIDEINDTLPPLKDFILPGGNKSAALCHICRSVCRRAERHFVSLIYSEDLKSSLNANAYINRLSDFFFVLARILARKEGNQEVLWQSHYKDSNR